VLGLVLVLAVDWFMGIARAAGNMIGNCVATVVIAAWEKDIDKARAKRVLNGEVEVDLDEHVEEFMPAVGTVKSQ
jgi:aerobic C4-dicarboxylate transport protein